MYQVPTKNRYVVSSLLSQEEMLIKLLQIRFVMKFWNLRFEVQEILKLIFRKLTPLEFYRSFCKETLLVLILENSMQRKITRYCDSVSELTSLNFRPDAGQEGAVSAPKHFPGHHRH